MVLKHVFSPKSKKDEIGRLIKDNAIDMQEIGIEKTVDNTLLSISGFGLEIERSDVKDVKNGVN